MQHLDDLARPRHRRPRGETDRDGDSDDHEHQQQRRKQRQRSPDRREVAEPYRIVVERRGRRGLFDLGAKRRDRGGIARGERRDDEARDRQLRKVEPGAEPRRQRLLGVGARSATARRRPRPRRRRSARPCRPRRRRRRRRAARIWMVISRDTSSRQAAEEAASTTTPPAHRQARKVRIAMTTVSARSATVSCGIERGDGGALGLLLAAHDSSSSSDCTAPSAITSLRTEPNASISETSWVAMTTEVPDLCNSTNSRNSRHAMSGSTLPVGSSASKQLGPGDQRARDRRALLFAARQHRRQRVDAVAEADPFEQFDDLVAVGIGRAALHQQRQRDIVVGRQMVEQAEILEHDADAAAHAGQVAGVERRSVAGRRS